MRSRFALSLLAVLIFAFAIAFTGCDGTADDPDVPTPPSTATLTGRVIAADDTTRALGNAEVTVAERKVVTGSGGSFTIENLPAGDHVVDVRTPQSATHGTARVRVPLEEGKTTHVNVAVLPLDVPAPEKIEIEPRRSVDVDLNGQIRFRATLLGPRSATIERIAPTWVVTGSIGRIGPDGVFRAETVGTGDIIAYAGDARSAVTIEVVEPRPPRISSFQINPRRLPASGGEIYASASISDGDGFRLADDVRLEIMLAGEDPIRLEMDLANPDTAVERPGIPGAYIEASVKTTWDVPPNTNRPDASGVQAPMTYTVSLWARDRAGLETRSDFVDVVVDGIDAPPTTPDI